MHAALARAATEDMLSEADYLAELPVVLSASRLSQPVDRAPAAVTIITRDMIEASGFRQLPDVFRLVPGFQVSWYRGSIQAVTYQGLSSIFSRHVQVLVDGRSVYNPGYGSVQWRGIPLALDDIDRIEVVRGPNAANDGINAVVASIHIYTRPASASPGWTVGAAAGTEDIRDGLLRYGGARGDWQWRATLNSRRDDWLENQRDGARDHLADLRAEWRPNDRDEVTLQMGAALGEWDESSLGGYYFSDQLTTDFFNGYAQARWQRTLSPDDEWIILASHTASRADETFPPYVDATLGVLSPDNLNYRFSRSAIEFSRLSRPARQLRTVWTAEARLDRAWSASLAGDETHDGAIYRLSGNLEWTPLDAWVLHAGAMLEKHYYAGTRLSPRLALNWLPERGHSVRVGISRAYRSPTFLEQESDFKTTAGPLIVDQWLLSPYELKPERMDSAEVGYLYHHDRSGLDLDVRLFRNRLEDIVDLAAPYPVPGELMADGADITFANLYEARQCGAEYQLRWQAGRGSWLALTQSWVHTRADTRDLRESAPDRTLSLLASHDFGSVTGSLGYYRVASMRWVNSEDVPAYDRLDLRVARAFTVGKTRADLALVAQSVLGDYSEFGVDRFFEPRAYVSFKAHF
ncbi:MAG TPA: TonB-dependent receptor [Thiobacillaceae bacterium]